MSQTTKLGFFHGLKTIPRAFSVLQRAPKLVRWLAIPFALTVLLDGLLFYFSYGWLSTTIKGWLDLGWFSFLLDIIAAVLVFFTLYWSFAFIFLTCCELVLDYISEEVEALETSRPVSDPEGLTNILRSVWMSIVQAVLLTGLQLVFLMLGFIPVLGQVLLFGFTTAALGYAFFSIPAGRRLHSLSQRWALTRQHLGAVMGLGLMVLLTGFLPVLNVALLPLFVVAGTLLYLDTEKQ